MSGRSTPRSAPCGPRSGWPACSPCCCPTSCCRCRRRREPPKSPQFSETEFRSYSMPGGDTTCSQTSPRSSLMDEMRSPYGSSARVVLAEVARADRGGLLGDVQPVGLGEQREDAVRVVRRDRQAVLGRKVAVHDRRLCALGRVVDREGVLEPGRVARQLREAGVARGVEPVAARPRACSRAARRAAPPRSAPASRRPRCARPPRPGRRAWTPATPAGTGAGTRAAPA